MKHGGNLEYAAKRYGFHSQEMIDLSTGISPYPYPFTQENISPTRLRSLPQAEDEARLMELMRSAWSVPDEATIMLAAGTGGFINQMPFLRQGMKQVLLPDPVYSEHPQAWASAGCALSYYDAGSLPCFSPTTGEPQAIITVQPGNPMGGCFHPDAWQTCLDVLVASDNLLIVDEAFIDLMPENSLMKYGGQRGLIILRSFGKFYGLAGLRLGAAIGHENDIARLESLLGVWRVSTPALDIGTEALADKAWGELQRQRLAEEMREFCHLLTKYSFEIIGGTSLYTLVYHPKAEYWHEALAQKGIWTRVFAEKKKWIRFGLPALGQDYTRVLKALSAID